jgi:hypothetical protein
MLTSKSFLTVEEQDKTVPVSLGIRKDKEIEREPVRLMAIGSREGVLRVIHTLHRLRFAEVSEWSPLLPAPTPGEVMSILTRYLCLKSEEG